MTLRIALAGPGRFGIELGRVLKEQAGVELVGIWSHTPATAIDAGRTLGAPAFASYDELLSAPHLDAVAIASSHGSHRQLAIDAARAGVHIFCEKPMAITVAECREMITAAELANVKLFIGHSLRHHPLVGQATTLVRDGDLGDPIAVTMLRFASHLRFGWWSRRAEYGGMLHSPGVHELDLMNALLGRATTVYAQAAPRIQQQTDYDDTMIVQVQFESGAIGVLASSISDPLNDPGGREAVRVLCRDGGLAIDFGREPWLEIQRRGEALERITTDADPWATIRAELSNFTAWLRGEEEPLVRPAEALAAVELCEAAYRSAASGRPVRLPL